MFCTNVFSPDSEYHSQAPYFQHFSYYPSFFLPVQILIILSSSSLLQQFNFSSNINSHIIFSQYYLLTYLFSNDCIFNSINGSSIIAILLILTIISISFNITIYKYFLRTLKIIDITIIYNCYFIDKFSSS